MVQPFWRWWKTGQSILDIYNIYQCTQLIFFVNKNMLVYGGTQNTRKWCPICILFYPRKERRKTDKISKVCSLNILEINQLHFKDYIILRHSENSGLGRRLPVEVDFQTTIGKIIFWIISSNKHKVAEVSSSLSILLCGFLHNNYTLYTVQSLTLILNLKFSWGQSFKIIIFLLSLNPIILII